MGCAVSDSIWVIESRAIRNRASGIWNLYGDEPQFVTKADADAYAQSSNLSNAVIEYRAVEYRRAEPETGGK